MLSTTNVDPFSTKDLISLPELENVTTNTWPGFCFQAEPQNALLSLAEAEEPKLAQLRPDVLRLDIADFPVSDLENISNSPGASSETRDEDIQKEDRHTSEVETIWNAPEVLNIKKETKITSWDHFRNGKHQEPSCVFLSEAGPAAFDLLLRKFPSKSHNEQIQYIQPDIVIGALFELGLGRSSALFLWNHQSGRFDITTGNCTISGLSHEVMRYVVDQYLDAGAQFRRLRSFTFSQHGQTTIKITLQTAIKTVLDCIEDAAESFRHVVRSLMQLQDAYEKPFLLLGLLDRLMTQVRSISNDTDLVAAVLLFAEQSLVELPHFEDVLHGIVAQLIEPVLRCIEIEIGLVSRNNVGELQTESIVSSFLSAAMVQVFHQTKTTLQFLGQHHRNTPPLQMYQYQSGDVSLKLQSKLEGVANSEEVAQAYEIDLAGSMTKLASLQLEDQKFELQPKPPEAMSRTGNPFLLDIDLFEEPTHYLGSETVEFDRPLQYNTTVAITSNGETSSDAILSCRQAINLSVGPLLRAQHRLLSYSVFQILFQECNFVANIELLGRFQLLQDGQFTSKLSTSLFDPEQVSGEGKRKQYGRTGLRLQSRETWPPASSELRLVLMDILSESMSNVQNSALLDSISFAIRDLSDEDLERCRDIDSIYALDFLRLNFQPQNPLLASVITFQCLDKYDKIFHHLLRLLRMRALTESMLQEFGIKRRRPTSRNGEHKFRIQARHFVAALADYCQNSVVKVSWLDFETRIQQIEERLKEGDYTGTLRLAGGLEHLREIHEDTLDRIMRGLMLKRKQSEGKGIIDRLFEVILRITALITKANQGSGHLHDLGIDDGDEYDDNGDDNAAATKITVPRLYRDFEAHMKTLVAWLQTQAAKPGNEGAEMYEQLLLKLDWNGYWSRREGH